MAVAKLIYSPTLQALQTTYDWDGTNSAKENIQKSIAFCADGYIVTRGKIFKTALGSGDNPYQFNITEDNKGAATFTLGGVSKTITIGNVIQNYNGSLSKAYILGGQGASDNSNVYGATLWNPNVYANLSTGVIYAKDFYIIDKSKTITQLIDDSLTANQAMRYKGVINLSNATEVTSGSYGANVGDTWKVGQAGQYTLTTSNGQQTLTLEVGDTLIVEEKPATGNPVFTILQTNIDGALTQGNLNGTASGNLRPVKMNSNNLYVTEAAIKATVGSSDVTLVQATTNSLTLKGAGLITLSNTGTTDSVLTITSNATAYTTTTMSGSASTITGTLAFSKTFVNTASGIDLVWEEIDASGNKTYTF